MADTPAPTTAEIKETLQQVQAPKDFPGEFKLGDGTVVKAANWQEAFEKVAEMKSNTAAALRDREAQIETLRQQTAQQQTQQQTQTRQVPGSITPDQKRIYWELMNTDEVAAANYIDAIRMGVDNPADVPRLFNEIRNVSTFSADNFEIQSFMQKNPDFPGTDEAADYLINRLAARNAPLTADGLEYEYLKGVRDGVIEPLGDEVSRPFVPPNLQGASLSRDEANILNQLRDPNQVPDDKLDEFARRIGILK
jgi:hypothetical protein